MVLERIDYCYKIWPLVLVARSVNTGMNSRTLFVIAYNKLKFNPKKMQIFGNGLSIMGISLSNLHGKQLEIENSSIGVIRHGIAAAPLKCN